MEKPLFINKTLRNELLFFFDNDNLDPLVQAYHITTPFPE
jgi:hypothetical protein